MAETTKTETWTTQSVYQCYCCGSYLKVSSVNPSKNKCPHCGIIQFGVPICRFSTEETE